MTTLVKLCEGAADKPALLCLPGAMCSPQIFAAMAQASGHPGYGFAWLEGSGPFDLPALAAKTCMLAEQIGPVILVGHSVGSAIAVLAARQALAQRSAAIAGLLLSNSGANTRGLADIDSLIDRIATQWGPEFWQAFAQRCIGTAIPAQLMECLQAYPAQLDPAAAMATLQSLQATDLLPLLPALGAIPAAVVHGRFDRARTLAHAEEMAGAIPASRLHVLDTGHTSAAEAPAEFAAVVRQLAQRAADGNNMHGAGASCP